MKRIVNTKENSIKFGFVLNSAFTVVAFIFGIITGSLALTAAATDGLLDSFTLTIAYVANRVSKRRADDSKSFGYGRATILAALLNATIMFTVSIFIATEAISRLNHPHVVSGGIVAIVAFLGLLVSGSIALVLSKHRGDLNMRGVFIDNAIDAIASLTTLVAGLVMAFTKIQWIDTVAGLGIAVLLIYSAFKVLKEAVQILLEGTPANLDLVVIKGIIEKTAKVIKVDDLHVWAIHSGYNALSCHIVITKADLLKSRDIVEATKVNLLKGCNIHHATIEVEFEHDTHDTEHEQH